jgi:hypothetical protein
MKSLSLADDGDKPVSLGFAIKARVVWAVIRVLAMLNSLLREGVLPPQTRCGAGGETVPGSLAAVGIVMGLALFCA